MDSPESPTVNGNNSATKRKSDGEQPRIRAKRNRYISIACNECKRRKIKCNGQTPCQRCGNFNLDCVYAPNCCNSFKETDDYQAMAAQISILQQQVQTLFSSVGSLTRQLENVPQHNRSMSVSTPLVSGNTPSSRFHGPTSATFNLDVAKTSLRSFGIAELEEIYRDGHEDGLNAAESPIRTPPPVHTVPPRLVNEFKDVMWAVSKEEAIRLVNIWKDNINIMYPLVNIEQTLNHIDTLYDFMISSRQTPLLMNELPGAVGISDDETIKLKLILANAATLEDSGPSEIGEQLFASVAGEIESLIMRPPHLKSVEQLALAAFFYFHRDDDALAWRIWGIVGRMCFELGWHQIDTFYNSLTSSAERYRVSCLFWSIYVLDRRWSFGTGLPFAIQEDDIDPLCLKPDGVPYLNSMITLTELSSKVWPRMATIDSRATDFNIEDLSYLDYQVVSWQENLPQDLQWDPSSEIPESAAIDTNSRLRLLLYLRGNQTRILIGRPVLLSTDAILGNLIYVNKVINVARETIRMLSSLHQTTELYRRQQLLYNYFLMSALTAIFLAVAHAPAQFSTLCREEFHLALDLIRGLSANSFVGKRLWKTVKVLKELGPKIGLSTTRVSGTSETSTTDGDAHSNAAVAMAGLAGHPMDKITTFGIGFNCLTPAIGENWDSMAEDLTNLYEAAEQNGPVSNAQASDGARGDDVLLFSGQDQLSRIFRDMF